MESNDFIRILTRKNSLRKAFMDDEVSVSTIDKVIQHLSEFRESKAQFEAEQIQAEAAKKAALKEVKLKLRELGLTPDDLIDASFSVGPKKSKVVPKYRLIDADGKPHEWSGRGRTPRVFQERIDRGAKKEDFQIVS
jgi:DNA-binding protein H-NS